MSSNAEEVELDGVTYKKLNFQPIYTLEDKMKALLEGETLLLKRYESRSNKDVLVKLEMSDSAKFDITKISYDLEVLEGVDRHWITYNVTVNDISLFPVYVFEEDLFTKEHRFEINDTVYYEYEENGERKTDIGIIESIYQSEEDPLHFAYKVRRDSEVHYEDDLVLASKDYKLGGRES